MRAFLILVHCALAYRSPGKGASVRRLVRAEGEHHRLAVVDPESGHISFVSTDADTKVEGAVASAVERAAGDDVPTAVPQAQKDYDPDDSKDVDPGAQAPGATEDPALTTTVAPDAVEAAVNAAEVEVGTKQPAEGVANPPSLVQSLRGDDAAVEAEAAAGDVEVAQALADEKAAEADGGATEELERILDTGANDEVLGTDPPATPTTETPTGEASQDVALDNALGETAAEETQDVAEATQAKRDEDRREQQNAAQEAKDEQPETQEEKLKDLQMQTAFVEIRRMGGGDASADDAADMGMFVVENAGPTGNDLADDAVDVSRVRHLLNEPQMEIDKALAEAVGVADKDAKRMSQ